MNEVPLSHLFFNGIVALLPLSFFTLHGLNLLMPKSRWFCDKLGWHKAPTAQGFDGCSMNGRCRTWTRQVFGTLTLHPFANLL
ncbi:MAG: hypothetical protein GF334_08620 [Candidatus Altiarchaeales archaeon]|nr:hypothetical protein [Candidatus Altiarchaeales archaeon]